eukprot:IDg18095t1
MENEIQKVDLDGVGREDQLREEDARKGAIVSRMYMRVKTEVARFVLDAVFESSWGRYVSRFEHGRVAHTVVWLAFFLRRRLVFWGPPIVFIEPLVSSYTSPTNTDKGKEEFELSMVV